MNRGLTSYGDEEFSRFLRRVFTQAMGFSDEATDRTVIGIADTSSAYNSCHGAAPELVEAIKRGVLQAGGLPMPFPTISIHESFAYPTSMLLRNLMAMDTEEMLQAQPMDAAVLIGGCDKTVPAQLMGAISADRPFVSLVVGPMLTGRHQGERLGACTDCRRFWGKYRADQIDEGEIAKIGGRLAATVGTCMVMGTASTMACIAEALGVALPGSAAIPTVHAERRLCAEVCGKVAVEIAATDRRPSRFLTAGSFRNALVILQAIGGSANALIHLAAIARRAGHRIDMDDVNRIGSDVPLLVDLKPAGGHYMEDFHWAGGVPRLMRELRDQLDLLAENVTGKTVAEIIDEAEEVKGQTVIRTRSRPLYPARALAVVRGNLAPGGAVIKACAATPALMKHSGRAVVFDSVEDVAARIDSEDLDVRADDVLILRNAGPRGAPGMPEAGYIPIPRKLARAGVADMVRISDARMSGTAFGTIVVHITPEAAAGGPLGIVEDGDRIELDVEAGLLNLLISDEEWSKRLASRQAAAAPAGEARGYRKLYVEHVLQADEGCDFDFLVPDGDR